MSKSPFKESAVLGRIQRWNSTFPFDYLFRFKYKIPFGSATHRQMDFFDMKYDIAEEKFMGYILSAKKYGKEYEQQLLKPRKVDPEVRKEMEDQEFDALDLSQFDNMKVE